MPIYVYEIIRRDGKPGRRFEIMQRVSDPPLKRDPKTQKPVRRVIGSVSFLNNRFDKLNKQFQKRDKGRKRGLEL
jgi:predicted nucleic acid-binding Zn ribbon protein